MFWRKSLPPDPRHRPDNWGELWKQRLEGSGLWVRNWLEHQTRDAFWKHGSVCEEFARIAVPVYAIGGWADGYPGGLPPDGGPLRPAQGTGRAVGTRLSAHRCARAGDRLSAGVAALVGPLAQGRDTGIMDEPMLRLFMQDPAPPRTSYASRDGRWVAEPAWPSPNVMRTAFHLTAAGRLERDGVGADDALTLRSPLTVGMGAGKWCAYGVPGDLPTDQRAEDGGSLVFGPPRSQRPWRSQATRCSNSASRPTARSRRWRCA